MSATIPRDPVALMAARIAIGLMTLLIVLALWPRQDAPLAPVVQAQEPPTVIIVSPTAQAGPEPPAPRQAPAVAQAAPTAAPVAAAPADEAPSSQLVRNADGSVSLPGSETWMAPQSAAPVADQQLQIERDAAVAYQQLPLAAAPSLENAQPVTVRRPHTGR